MGFVHALEVLQALIHVCATRDADNQGLQKTIKLPYPHLQQRLQQTMRGILWMSIATVVGLMALLCVVPASGYIYPGLWMFISLCGVLISSLWLVLLLRFVLLPNFRSTLTSEAPMNGTVQRVFCAVFELAARLFMEPHIFVVLASSIFHSWLWKRCCHVLFASSSAFHASSSSTLFVLVGGIVSFVSYIGLENALTEDPFVLAPLSALGSFLQRDFVRALRRAFATCAIASLLSSLLLQHDQHSLRAFYSHVYFEFSTSAIEAFVWLPLSSMFRVLLFRATFQAVQDVATEPSVWESKSNSHGCTSIHAIFKKNPPQIDGMARMPLAEQYIVAANKRVDAAMDAISTGKLAKALSMVDSAVEHVEQLENAFKLANLSLVSRFDAQVRSTLFASAATWRSFVEETTGMMDSFTLSLQLLNSIPERRAQLNDDADASLFEQSLLTLLKHLVANMNVHPLLLLDKSPHLSVLHIASTGFTSRLQYYFDSRAQFAARRFLVEEARRRVFEPSKIVQVGQRLLCHLIAASRTEDVHGNVQHTIPAVLVSLVECKKALRTYMEMSIKNGVTSSAFMNEATALSTGMDTGIYEIITTFYSELPSLAIPSSTQQELKAYSAFNA